MRRRRTATGPSAVWSSARDLATLMTPGERRLGRWLLLFGLATSILDVVALLAIIPLVSVLATGAVHGVDDRPPQAERRLRDAGLELSRGRNWSDVALEFVAFATTTLRRSQA